MNNLGLGMGIQKQDASKGNGGGNPPVDFPTASFVVTSPAIVPGLDSGLFKIVLSETRLVDTSFTLTPDRGGFNIAHNPLVVLAGDLESLNSVDAPAADDGPLIISGVDDAGQVVVLNTANLEVVNPP